MQNVELETLRIRIIHLRTTRLTKFEVCSYKRQKRRNPFDPYLCYEEAI